MLAAALIGFIGGRLTPGKFRSGVAHGESHRTYGPARIDDHSPLPERARFYWSRTLSYALAGLGIWALVEGLLLIAYGWDGLLTQMGWFFAKAALVTFDGD